MKDQPPIVNGYNAVWSMLTHRPDLAKKLMILGSMHKAEKKNICNLADQKGIATEAVEHVKDDRGYNQGLKLILKEPLSSLCTSLPAFEEKIKMAGLKPVLVLDHIEDPQNFGSIIRTAAAFSVAAIIVAKDRQAPFNTTVFRVAAGNALFVDIVVVTNIGQALKRLKELGYWTHGADAGAKESIGTTSFDTSSVIVVGNEGRGLSPGVRRHCDHLVSIPTNSAVESLNVSVAAAIFLSRLG